MKLKDLLQHHYDPKEKFKPHSKNDLTSHMKKVLLGSHPATLGLKCTSTESQLAKGILLFKDKKTIYKIDINGKYYKDNEELGEVKKSSDLHSQYSNALYALIKWIENQ